MRAINVAIKKTEKTAKPNSQLYRKLLRPDFCGPHTSNLVCKTHCFFSLIEKSIFNSTQKYKKIRILSTMLTRFNLPSKKVIKMLTKLVRI